MRYFYYLCLIASTLADAGLSYGDAMKKYQTDLKAYEDAIKKYPDDLKAYEDAVDAAKK